MFRLPTKTALDKAFAIGLGLKALDAIVELVSGLFLLFVSPEQLQNWIRGSLAPELREGANGFVVTYLLHWITHLQQGVVLFAAIYLILHGVAKLVVVVEVLRGKSWAYVGLIVLLALFVVYQIYHMATTGLSPGYLLLTASDLIIIALTSVEYVRLRAHGI